MYKSFKSVTILAFAAVFLLGSILKLSAATYYTGASGTASTLTNWWTATNGTGTHPANFTTAGDVFTVQNGHTIAITVTTTWTVAGTLIINSGGVANLRSTSLGTLTILSGGTLSTDRNFSVTGNTNISGTISFSSSSTTLRAMTFTGDVVLNGGAVWNEPATGNGANNTYVFGGNFTNNATSFNALGTGVHTFSGTAKTLSGATLTSIGSITVTGTRTNSGTLTVRTTLAGTGTLTNGDAATGTLNIGGSASITGLTASAVNNFVNYTGTAQTAKVTTYNNLTLSGSLAKTFSTSPTVNGILSMEETATVVVTTGVVTYGANATLQYNTATSRTTSSEEWITPFTATGGVIIANTGAIIMNEAKVFNASIPLTINNGATLDTKSANSFSLTLGGNFVNNGGTLIAYASPVNISSTMVTQTISGFTTTGTISLTKSAGTATFQGNVNGGQLTINGSGTGGLNLGTVLTHTFTGDVNFLGGSLNGGSSTLNENNISGTAWNGNGTLFSAGTGKVNFGGGAQSLAGTGTTTFYNLTVSNSGLKTFNNIPIVNGIFSLEGTATVSAASVYGSNATLQYNTATPRTAGVEWINTFTASGGVVIANTGTITMNSAKIFGATAPLTINSGSSLSMSSYLLTLNGNFINNGGNAVGTTGGVTIAGTSAQSIGAFTTTGTVLMSKTGGTATFAGNVNGAGLTINGSGGILNLGTALTHTFTGVTTLTAGNLNGGSSTLNENAVSTSAWNGSGSLFTPTNSTINFGASGNQTLAASSLSFHNLAFSGSGNKIIASAVPIAGNLSISGTAKADLGSLFVHSANSLTLGGSIQVSGTWGSTTSGATYKNDTYFLSATGTLNVNCTAPSAPVSGGNQTICSGTTIPALSVTVVSGTADWYDQADGGIQLLSNSLTYTPVVAGIYYAETDFGGCLSPNRTEVILTINPLPSVLVLTGSSICTNPGGNGTITSTSSVIGINYQLYNSGNSTVQAAKSGTGSPLSWTLLSAGAGYYVIGTNTITNCTSTSSHVNIAVSPDPVSLTITGSTICASPGGNGIISSATSESGVNYQLYDGSNAPVHAIQAGTGTGLAWAGLPAGTGYYVKGTNAGTSCVSSMSNTVSVASAPNPVAPVLAGSTICSTPGNNGTITSSSSQIGVDYQLYDITDLEVGMAIPGTGSGIAWSGLVSGTGYYVIGTSGTTSCTSANSNAVAVSSTPNPTITSSAAAATVCFSSNPQNTTLAYSATTNSPTNYTITWNATALAAGLQNLSTTSLPASPVTVPVAANVTGGTYAGTLTVTTGDCASIGNPFTLTINAPPAAPSGSASQVFSSGATVSNLSATGTGIAWYAAASGGSPLSTSLTLVNGTHYYASQTVSGCESTLRFDVTATVAGAGSWIGITNTNWFTTSNWGGGVLPLASTNVTIPAGLTNYPSIGASGAVCNNINIASGASLTIVGSNTLTVSGNWIKSGTFVANASTVDFNGSGAGNIGASNFYNVIYSGAGTKTATGVLGISGNVSITNNFTAGAFTHTVGGNWINSGTFIASGSTINFNGSGVGNINAGNFNNITFTGAGAKTATGALTIAGNVTITNNFTSGAYTHTVSGNWTKSGTFTHTGSTIDFNGSGAGNIGAGNFNNIIFSGSGTKTATGALNIIGSVTITGNFSAGSYTHTLQGDWSNSGTFTANTSTFNFSASTPQNIGGPSSTTFNNFIQSGLGVITLGVSSSISGILTLTLGLIDIGNYNLTIVSSGSISGGSASSYIKTSGTGRLKQTVPGLGGSKIYPVGNSAYNPMTVTYNDINTSKNFSILVEDGSITNANSSKTINRKWFLSADAAGSSNLTLTATYNTGEEGSGFTNSSSPQIGYFDGTSWAYRPISSGSGTTTFTASGSAPDFSNTSGFFTLGSGDAFNASKLVVTSLTPANPTKGTANTTIKVQSQNSNSVPTMVAAATGFSLTCANTTMSTSPTGTISQYTYETAIASITFTESTLNIDGINYDHNATVTATQTSGESLSAGTSIVFDVYDGAIYEPLASENWDAANGWKKSTDGGTTWTNPATLPASNNFADNDLIRIPVGITLTSNVTASFYSVLVYGTLELNSSGALTLNHSSYSDYNIHVHGTLKNSGGTITNSNPSYPLEIHGGTYWHNMNGGSIPACLFYTLNSTLSTCKVTGITSSALTAGLNQTFENFTWDNSSQAVTQNLSADMPVSGALTLTAGKITTGSYHVIVGLNGTATNSGAGYINGTLRRYVASTVTTGDFPVGDANYYAPFSITVNSGTPSGNGYLDVSTTVAQPPVASGLSQTKYINRKWTISNSGVAGITTYNPACTFVDADKVGSPTTGSLKLRKFTASAWYTTNGTATGNTITATGLSTAGLTATSDFYAGEDDCSATNAIWLGSTSTDWNTATNWCSGSVPTATTDVTIASTPVRQPVIGSSGGTCKNITIQNGASLTVSGAFSLAVKGNWSNSGTFDAGNGTVSFTGTVAQTITGVTTINNLTINNTAGVTAANDITVNGALTLTSANPDASHGTLDMGSRTINMAESATNEGTGDVSGIVKRQHIFSGNTAYSFGSQYTTIVFTDFPGGLKPVWISCKITIGSAPLWRSGAVKRSYSFAQDGSGTDRTVTNLHYLDSELNSSETDETKLVFWDAYVGPAYGSVYPRGKSNSNNTNNWIGLSGMAINFIAPSSTLDYKQWGLGYTNVAKITWTGNGSPTYAGDWSLPGNWNGGVPTANDDVLIPATLPGNTNGYPTRNLNWATVPAVCKTLEIEASASVTVDNYNITIAGSTGAWNNSGTFIPGTGTVNFTHGNIDEIVTASGLGTNQFHNINIAANTFIRPGTGFHMKINGWVLAQLTSIVDLSSIGTTVEYNGTSQTIVNPSHSGYKGYYNIIFSGTGTSTLYDGTLDIYGDFTTNGTLGLSNSTVSFIGTSAQTINGSATPLCNNLTINNATGVTATTDLTVNGTLYLQSENPSSLDKGTLAMASGKILNLGVDAYTTGTSDVSGIIKRTHAFAPTTFYSFGNGNQGVTFPSSSGPGGLTSLAFNVTIGTTPSWGGTPANATNRTLAIAQTGATITKAIVRINYIDNELANGVNESALSIWNRIAGSPAVITDKGWSNKDVTNNFISISDINLSTATATIGDYQLAIAPTSATFYTWNGSISTDWNTAANWTPNGTPGSSTGAIIPDANTTVYQPTLPATGSTQATCQYIIIQTNGILNAGSGATLTISDGVVGDAWGMEAGGTFNAGNSNVIFSGGPDHTASLSGNTNFYNVTIASDSKLRPAADSYMGIAGDLVNNGTLSAVTNENTIEFKGSSSQTIPNPNGNPAGYHNLILSGSGTKILPVTLNIVDEFTNNTTTSGTVSSGSGTVVFDGNAYGEVIGGATITTFNNLTLNNSYGLTLSGVNAEVDGTCTLTSGKITTGANKLILGNSASVSGASAGKYVYGNLQKGIAASTSTKIFEIGNASDYLPFTIDFAGAATNGTGSLTCSTTNGQQPEYASSGLNQTRYINRYWTVTNAGVTFGTYDATFTFVNPGDIIGSANLSALLIKKYSGSAWSATTTESSTTPTVKTTGNTSFGDFVAAEAASNSTDYFRSVTTGNWSSPSTWESSLDGITWGAASLAPDNAAHSITISGGYTVTVDATATASNLYIAGTLTSGSGIGLSVNGIWQNTGYYDAGSGTITFNGTSAQTIGGATAFNNLTINNAAGVTANANQTVNGVLNLISANASATHGALHMVGSSEYILYMGANATTTGTGDVTGYIRRSSFELNTSYSFGNQYTVMEFTVGPLPNTVTLELYLAPVSWKPDAIHRYIDVSRTGGSPDTRLRFNFHYLDSELNGATEGNLDLFDYHVSIAELHDHGRTDYSSTNNWVGYANVGLAFLGTAATDDHFWTMGTSTTNDLTTWIGGSPSGPTDWDLPGNWEGGVPLPTSSVIIPGGRTYYPVLPSSAMPDGTLAGGRIIKTLEIQLGGVLNATTGTPTLTINGSDNAWQNFGTLNAGNSTMVFTNPAATMSGTTSFYNVTIDGGAAITPVSDNTMGIAGTLIVTGTLNATTNPNTIEFNGTAAQTVPALNFYNLTISGERTSNNVTLASGGTIGVAATFAPTATFSSGSYIVTSNTVTLNGTLVSQELAHPFMFNNLTTNNSAGIVLSASQTVTGILTFANGILTTGSNILTIGSSGSIAGATTSRYLDGKLAMIFSSAGSKTFAIGKGGNYRPVTFEYTDLTGTSTITAEQFESTLPGTLPVNTILFSDRYWSITESGATAYHYKVTLDGTGYSPSHTGDVTIIKGGSPTYSTLPTVFSSPGYTNTTTTTGFGYFGLGDSGNRWLGTTGDWFTASNWTAGVIPATSDWLTIPAGTPNDPVISGAVPVTVSSSGKIDVGDGATLTLQAGPLLTLSDGATVTTTGSGVIIVKPGGAYLNLSSSAPTLQAELTIAGSKGWRMIASPVVTSYSTMFAAPAVTQGFGGSAYPDLQPNLLWWNEKDGGTTLQAWRAPGAMGSNIPGGLGHFFYIFGGATKPSPLHGNYSDGLPLIISATGVENFNGNGSFNLGVTKTARTTGTSTSTTDITAYAANEGWNLIGNPTVSSLNWDAASGWTKTAVDNTIYVWDNASGNYLVWNGSIGSLGNGMIAPFQAFWVRANASSPLLSMTNAVKSATAGTFKSALTDQTISIPIRIKGLGMETTSYISFSERGVVGEDPKDAYRLQPMSDSWLALYMTSSVSHRDPLVINNLPLEISETLNIPLFVDAGKSGKSTGGDMILNWEIPSGWPSEYVIELMDNQQHKAISMLSQNSYNFKQTANKSAGIKAINPLDLPSSLIVPTAITANSLKSALVSPFSIVIRKGLAGDKPVYESQKPELLPLAPNPFQSGTTISFTLPENSPVRIDAFDLNGRLLETVVNGEYPSGLSTMMWIPKIWFNGACILRMKSGSVVSMQKGIRLNQ